MDKNKKSVNTIYDDSVSNSALMKDIKKKLDKKTNINIDNISIEEKANTVIQNLDKGNSKLDRKTNKVDNRTVNQNKKNIASKKKEETRDSKVRKTVSKRPQNSRTARENSIFEKDKLKVIPLGGLQEIGKNLTVFEYRNEIIIVDCGVAFPDDDMLGVDLVIPDVTYLEKNAKKIKGMVITHGHEDHIGAIPYFLKKINVPVYATKLTMGLIEAKLEEHNILKSSELHIAKPKDIVKLGKYFNVEFIKTTHSIADAVAFAIHTPVGTVVHTGDFKIDYTPIDGEVMDFARFAELGKEGVLLLMSDSTNVERPGYTMSERSVGLEFDKIFMNSNKRIIVATFASNIHRMQQIINSAVKFGRKVAAIGRSVLRVIDVAL